jgi:hypothetical protein
MRDDIRFQVAHHQLTYQSPTRDRDGTCKFCNSPAAGRRLFCERCLPERSDIGGTGYAQIYNLLYRACGFINGSGAPSCRLHGPKPPAVPKPLAVMPCGVCDTIFKQVQTRQKFCSKKCSKSASRRRSIDRKRPDRKRRGVCMYCGIACEDDQGFSCNACKKQKKRERFNRVTERRKLNGRTDRPNATPLGTCRNCGNKCEIYVCDVCKHENVRFHRLKHRLQMKEIESERYTPTEIAERDGWRCQLCRKPVNRRKRWPDPLSASIDHIVPITKGGTDVRANVQLAHLRCNISKGNRVRPDGEQLRLLG